MGDILSGLTALGDPQLIGLIVLTTIAGTIIGVLPGLNATTGAALLLPFTLTMEPVAATVVLATIYGSATFAGAITAILINTPGTSASATTCLDGYPLAKAGEAGRALGVATIASTIGGFISIIFLFIAAPLMARLAYDFGPPEYFALTLFGLSMLATIGGGSALKNLIAGAFGVLLATVGVDLLTGVERYTFGTHALYEGIGFVPVMIGIFGIAELLGQSNQLGITRHVVAMKAAKLPTREDFRRIRTTIFRSTGIGTFIGVLPAEGATIASMISYNEARRWSPNRDNFGKGEIEGIAASEAANNSAIGGSLVPTLALGIPGSPTAAIILAGLLTQGIQPGPTLFAEQGEFLGVIFAALLVANLLFVVVGLGGAPIFARITTIPVRILWPLVFLFSIVGAYAIHQSVVDVYIALAFGVIGFLMNRYGFSVVSLAIGLVLGAMVEQRLGQSVAMFRGEWWMIFSRPIALVFFALTLLALFGPALKGFAKKRKAIS
ncbi:tripartite tricarboxylate transporter permease [Qingshengfaniella alkalisoli]|uniref:C4-dicarboxylate ABC transporter permease n=1 Tax=Qingshengfaniella alkalisoli TaxID=2599296 RepID=A0A5B8J347_9RHOB|nr:tripartite tricarboxylate transporter permease [Qingshengfaniella alkalisoli]QDY71178.1 C4-dicarboxylate ABC transporter permease [Qingshengfaniella alkalisoli]